MKYLKTALLIPLAFALSACGTPNSASFDASIYVTPAKVVVPATTYKRQVYSYDRFGNVYHTHRTIHPKRKFRKSGKIEHRHHKGVHTRFSHKRYILK